MELSCLWFAVLQSDYSHHFWILGEEGESTGWPKTSSNRCLQCSKYSGLNGEEIVGQLQNQHHFHWHRICESLFNFSSKPAEGSRRAKASQCCLYLLLATLLAPALGVLSVTTVDLRISEMKSGLKSKSWYKHILEARKGGEAAELQ